MAWLLAELKAQNFLTSITDFCTESYLQMFSQPVPRVFLLFKMAAAREKTLTHSRSRVSNEDGDVFKMAATAKRVRRTGYEMLR